jgi:hypothetical protein
VRHYTTTKAGMKITVITLRFIPAFVRNLMVAAL